MNQKFEDDSLWKLCQKAVDETLNQGTLCTGFAISRCLKNLRELTSPAEWSKEFLFDRVANTYIRIYANQIGKRAGIKGKCIYFDEESMNKSIAEGLVFNEEKLVQRFSNKEMDLRVKRDAIDGQMSMDTEGMDIDRLYQEVSLETLTNLIHEIEEDEADALDKEG